MSSTISFYIGVVIFSNVLRSAMVRVFTSADLWLPQPDSIIATGKRGRLDGYAS